MAVAEVVVDLFEVIEIAKQQAAGGRALDLGIEPLHQTEPVGQAGERVAAGQLPDLLLPLAAQGDFAIEPLVAHQ